MKKRGFTLIELLLTMGIIGAVAALTVPGLASNFSKSHIGNTLARTVEQIELGNRKIIETANMEYTQNGDSPTDTLGGISLKDIPHSETDASDTDSFAEAIQDVASSYWAVSELNLTDTEESAISSAKVYDGSSDSEYAEECLKLFDYWFSEEGAMYCNWGIEGDTYELNENNEPAFTDKILSNPDGLSFAQAMAYYTFPPARPVYQDWTRELGAVPEKDLACYDVFGQGTNSEAMPAPGSLNMDPELYTEYSTLMTDIQTVVDERTPQFISGVLSLDEYDAYLQTLKEMNIDRVIEIVQQAYDNFMAN